MIRTKLSGDARGISPLTIKEKLDKGENTVFLDVRNQNEYNNVYIKDSILIPLGQLRERPGELSEDKEIIAFCKISLRGYGAGKIFCLAEFKDTKSMDGGVVTRPFAFVHCN